MSKKSTTKNKKTEYNPYAIDRLATINPKWKIGILKFWAVGAAFYATVFTLPPNFDFTDRMVALWLVLVLVFEYIVFTIIHWMHTDNSNTKKYLPHEINRKSILSLFATGGYVLVVLIFVHFFFETWVYYGLPTIGDKISETSFDPISFGLLYLLIDYIWIRIRNTIKSARQIK